MKVDVQCPFCGECYIRKVQPDKSPFDVMSVRKHYF